MFMGPDPLGNRGQVQVVPQQDEEVYQVSATDFKVMQIQAQLFKIMRMDPSQVDLDQVNQMFLRIDPSQEDLMIQMFQSCILMMLEKDARLVEENRRLATQSQVSQPLDIEAMVEAKLAAERLEQQAREEKIKQEVEAKFQAELADQKKTQEQNRALLQESITLREQNKQKLTTGHQRLSEVKETQVGIKETQVGIKETLSNGQKRLTTLVNSLVL